MSTPAELTQRQRILLAAARLFRSKGYPATTMRMIASEVGLGASSLYNHISSKQELLRTICFESAGLFNSGLKDIEKDNPTSIQSLASIIQLHVSLAIDHPETVTVFNDEWRHLEKDELIRFRASRQVYQTRLQTLLFRNSSNKNRTSNPEVAIPSLLASLSWIYNLHAGKLLNKEDLSRQLFTLWANGWTK